MNPRDIVPNAKENMWTLAELLNHFESIGKPNIWRDKIYAGIKKNILAAVFASFEVSRLEEGNFEMNGADFMVGFDLEPILIEVNSKPALFFSKTVVEIMTEKLLEDVVKVTVDRRKNPEAETGDFEMIHSEEIPSFTSNFVDLKIVGKNAERLKTKISFKLKPESRQSEAKIN
jgi:hypothetical protein